MEGKMLMENLAGAGSSPAHAARSFSGDYSLGKPARAILGSKGLPCVPYQHVTSLPPRPHISHSGEPARSGRGG